MFEFIGAIINFFAQFGWLGFVGGIFLG